MHQLTITRPAALGNRLAAAAAALAAAPPSVDVLLAELALGLERRTLDHLRAPDPAPLVAARYAAWTGDLATIAAIWQPLRAAALRVLADDGAPDRARTCAALERTATDLGDTRLAADLHRAARAADTPGPPGHPAAGDVLRIVHTILGLEPDAPRGRLVMRPRLDAMPALAAHHIPFAAGSVRLDCSRSPLLLTCRVAQDAGAIPFTLLLEPHFTGRVRAARVDGRAATLDSRLRDGVTAVPVQLLLDDERVLSLELDA
ncbi:MAG TPA: hypothetical protein VMN60_05865 [Longimicrobiales bacterium]|nr:hypothetical protein [Longimicrobiales bacterium]